jgi:hypothetical protein
VNAKGRPDSGPMQNVQPSTKVADIRITVRKSLRAARGTMCAGAYRLGQWLTDRLDRAGNLPASLDRRTIMREQGIGATSFCKYMKMLEPWFGRRGIGQISRRTGRYAHMVRISLSDAIKARVSDLRSFAQRNPTPHKAVTGGLHGVDVVSPSSATRRLSDEQAYAERRKTVANWPRAARSKTDLPLLRPCAASIDDLFVRTADGRLVQRVCA